MLSAHNISKSFKLYQSPADRLKEIVFRRSYHKEYHALMDISFEVGAGETLGIVGQNGAGKSTLLKILTGVLIPDTGLVHVDGRITGLLELGTGFNPEFSGKENIFLNGGYLGLSRAEIEERFDRIVDFTELGDFIDESIKTYSSGMIMRLAFSVAIHADPGSFVIDEALSVGDAYFQQKCMRKIREFRDDGGSIVFVSHDMNAVKVLCDKAILLDGGRLIDYGTPKDIIDFYQGMILKKSHQGDMEVQIKQKKNEAVTDTNENTEDASTGEVEIISCRICDAAGKEVSYVLSENEFIVEYEIKSLTALNDPHFGIAIRNKFGVSIFETNTYCMKIKTKDLQSGETCKVKFNFNCKISQGDYSVCIGVANEGYGEGSFKQYQLVYNDILTFKVISNLDVITYSGIFNMDPVVYINDVPMRSLEVN